MSSLTGWDWFVVLVMLGSIAVGLWRGLIRTVFGLGAWVVGLVGAPLAAPAAIEATGMQAHPWVVLVVMFVALFVTIRLMGSMVARLLGKIGLGGADRGLGALLGAARAVLLLLVVAVAARALKLDETASWREAHSRPLLDALVHLAEPYLPQRIGGVRET